MEELILSLATKQPALVSILTVIGGLRVVVKPLMAYYESHVEGTEDKKDDERLAKLKANKFYKGFVFLLDYTASVKLPKK